MRGAIIGTKIRRKDMTVLYISLAVVLLLLAVMLITSYVCFRMIFLRKYERDRGPHYVPVPPGEEYVPYREGIKKKILEARELPHEDFEITSFDGLVLRGRYYEAHPGAPIELMMHGYRGTSERDLSAGIFRAHNLGRNALLVDHRASGTSEGKIITFGVNEKRDCLTWIDFMVKRFGSEQKIILTGISMGAATVMLASAEDLPGNVIGVLADCGYTSAEKIIAKVIRDMKLPVPLLMPFVRIGARLFGGFDLSAADATAALRRAKVPVIFYHGESDGFVPCDMSRENYDACITRKELVTIPGADHGLCYMKDPERYEKTLGEFFE